jgi:chromosomal replication initiator protein
MGSAVTQYETRLLSEIRSLKEQNKRLTKKLQDVETYYVARIEDIKKDYAETIVSLNKRVTILSKPLLEEDYIDKVFNSILLVTGFTKQQLCSALRKRELVIARHIAFYCLKQKGYALNKIGEYFGGRDHATVINALKKMKNWEKVPKSYKNELDLKNKIKDILDNYDNIQITG